VEIDPGIYSIGKNLHPESPYTNPKVKVVIDDARSFLKKSTERYDLISFGLLDSHTQSSSYNNTRIDHYVYTQESFLEAKNLLKEDGVLTVVFEVPRLWVDSRIAGMLEKTFGEPPLSFTARSPNHQFGLGGTMFVIGKNMPQLRETLKQDHELRQFIEDNQVGAFEPVKLTTDDWPYLYLEKPQIPALYLCLSAILLLMFGAAKRFVVPRGERINWHFFFLGAAFLLLEFQNISKMALLFGSTWLVNSLTISAILLLILLANGIAARFPKINLQQVYICLLVSVVVLYLVPLRVFNVFPFLPRVILAGLLLNLPILFAGIFRNNANLSRH